MYRNLMPVPFRGIILEQSTLAGSRLRKVRTPAVSARICSLEKVVHIIKFHIKWTRTLFLVPQRAKRERYSFMSVVLNSFHFMFWEKILHTLIPISNSEIRLKKVSNTTKGNHFGAFSLIMNIIQLIQFPFIWKRVSSFYFSPVILK